MNEGSPTGEKLDQYVEVLCDYSYEHKNQKYSLYKGEILMVHRYTTDHWWQVIRQGEMRAFFAPANHLRLKSLSEDEKQEILSGCSTSNEKTAVAGRSHEIDKGGSSPSEEHLPSCTTRASQAPKPYLGHHHESVSSHTSKSSLNESSIESPEYSGKSGIKTGSVDELRPKGHTTQTLDISKKRASSNEELDGCSRGSSDLSPRHRSSSVDLRMTPQEFSLTEMKQSSPDKTRKVRTSKEQWDRRRSWALENIRPSLKRGETVDAAIVLDVPPELPPKTKPKHRLSTFNSNSETISRLEGPIDLKVEQVRMAKSSQPPLGNELYGETETERKHSRHSSDPLVLHDEKTSSLPYQETHNGKDPPVALPRKLLPPQATSLEGRAEGFMLLCDHTLRDANGNKVKKSSSHSSLSTSITEGSGKGRELQGSFRQRDNACEPHHGKPSNTLEAVTKNDNITPSHKSRPESPKTRTAKSRFTTSLGSFRKNTKREIKEKEEREKELPARETPTPDSSRGGKVMQSPPSPRCPPQRTLSGDWGEYLDSTSKRPYYYNSNTREKRWKPPRKGVPPSNSIREVPVSTRSEDNNGRGNVPPKCPTPDYPSSPRSSHKPFSYTTVSDMPHFHPIVTRSATLNLSSTSTPHSTTAPLSHTLPNSATPAAHNMSPPQHASQQKVMPLLLSSPPAVPPSSAKPIIPTTPTTPEYTDTTTMSEYKNVALLDILHNLKLPQGWVKKYDAYNQRIYFHNMVTKERPRGVSCVSELDIAQLNNKQYTRKSYQSTMDLSKELQLDTNVSSDEIPSDPGDGSSCLSPATDDKERRSISSEHKIPPLKPPRKAYPAMTLSLASDEIVVKPNRPQQVEGQGRCLMSPTDHPSIVEAGSRVSSFTPLSSFSKPHGHSRSKSETLKINAFAPALDTSKQDSSALGEAMMDISKEALLPSSLNLESKRNRSPSPSNKTLSPQPFRFPVTGNSSDLHTEGDSKALYCTLPRLVICEKGMITGNVQGKHQMQEDTHPSPAGSENIDDYTKLVNAADKEGVCQASKMQYDNILKELNTYSLRPARLSPVTSDAEEGFIATETQEQANDSQSVDKGALSLETPFTLSKMSRLNHSQKIKLKLRERPAKHSEHSTTKPNNQIRNSSFISHDEDGSILENKPLSHLTQLVSSEASSVFQTDWPMELVNHPNWVLSHSEQDEFPINDDTEEMSPTWHCGGDGQECKSFQDPDKWLATTNDEGKVYYYEESGSKSAWSLPEVDEADLPDQEGFPGQPLSPPQENLRLSSITENLRELSDSTLREGFLHRTFYMRDGKKLRKNWTHSYARYIVCSFNSGSTGILHFSKSKDDEKKAEIFEFFAPCYLEHASDKKTSRQQVLGLRNGLDTEVLLQFEDREIAQEWIKVLRTHEGMEYSAGPTLEKEEKKGKKGSEKIKRETSVEQLSPDSKGIKDKLRNFIKRRPMKETLEHKGIYKESVFGSTLAELKSQEKTNIPIFVLHCIQHIEKSEENLRTDGLYRISGNAAQIQKIRFEVAQRKYTVLSQEKEIHNLSGALKLFFRELKEPLIPYDNYEDFIRATGSEYRRMNQQADKLMKAVNKLPVENYDTLKVLMQHLLGVSKYESENRMSISNLAIVFGPCLMWPRETLSHDLMTDVMLHNRVVEGLLSDFDKIFTKR